MHSCKVNIAMIKRLTIYIKAFSQPWWQSSSHTLLVLMASLTRPSWQSSSLTFPACMAELQPHFPSPGGRGAAPLFWLWWQSSRLTLTTLMADLLPHSPGPNGRAAASLSRQSSSHTLLALMEEQQPHSSKPDLWSSSSTFPILMAKQQPTFPILMREQQPHSPDPEGRAPAPLSQPCWQNSSFTLPTLIANL